MSEDKPSAAPGWYPDGAGGQRYWDGTQWTNQMASFPASPSSASPTQTKKGIPVWAWFIIVPVVGFIGLCLLGLFGFGTALNEVEKDREKEEAEYSAVTPPAKADVVTTADQITEEFEQNELKADTKYKGKWIEVTGTVSKIDTEVFEEDEYYVQLEGVFFWVDCRDMPTSELSKIDVEDRIKVIGKFDDGGDVGVDLIHCRLR